MIRQQRLIERFLRYVQIDSETRFEGPFMNHLVKELEQLGLEVHQDQAGKVIGSDGNNIVARLKGGIAGEPIIFSAHMDTVMPGKGVDPIIENGIIKSKSDTVLGSDDKAGIAAIMEALETLVESKAAHRTVEVILTIAEEGGLNGAKNLDMGLVKGKYGYVLDSGGPVGQIIIKAPFQDKLEVCIKGKPAHAGICPEEGISAIQVIARAIENMKLLRIDEETTANIGIIKGGETTNIVCPEAYIKAEARSLSEEKLDIQIKHMAACIENACDAFSAEAHIDIHREYGGYIISGDDPLLKYTEAAMRKMGLAPKRAASGGGSDTNIFNSKGLKLLNLSIGMSKVHTLDEYIKVSDLTALGELVYQLALDFNLQ